jgi:tRNA1Val (adenine37-N6)-methyltransferase
MTVFKLRQVDVQQANSPMKVGTDAMLLGASVMCAPSATSALDVGTGTGIIALLLAQRFSQLQILGIDPDAGAALDASTNFKSAPWASRLAFRHCSLQALDPSLNFDLIVSNPPYFIDQLPAASRQKQQAKHLTTAQYTSFLTKMELHLSETGSMFLILPVEALEQTQKIVQDLQLHLVSTLIFHGSEKKRNTRAILEFSRLKKDKIVQEKVIRNLDGTYHTDYIELAGEFHDRPLAPK